MVATFRAPDHGSSKTEPLKLVKPIFYGRHCRSRLTVHSHLGCPHYSPHILYGLIPKHGKCLFFHNKRAEEAVFTTKDKKAPGRDRISAAVYKLVFWQRLNLLLGAFNAWQKEGIFPYSLAADETSKGKGNLELASAYRPLYMLGQKSAEKLIGNRLA